MTKYHVLFMAADLRVTCFGRASGQEQLHVPKILFKVNSMASRSIVIHQQKDL